MPLPRRSKIGYTDYSGNDLNFCLGCTPVSAGCANCYARRIYDRFGKDFSKVTVYPDKLERLLKWQPKPPYKRGSRPLAFVCDMSDLFHWKIPLEFSLKAFLVMKQRNDIDWLVLTKRPKRMRWLLGAEGWDSFAAATHIWFGVTVENEDNLWRIDELLKTPAAVRWVSLEPLLGPVDVAPFLKPDYQSMGYEAQWEPIARDDPRYNALDWVIVGAESGPNRRPFEKEWAWDVLDQCREAGVACFLKQHSGLRPGVPLLDREGREVRGWPKT